MSAAASTMLPSDLAGFLQSRQLTTGYYEAIYAVAEQSWGKEKLRYDLHSSDLAAAATAITTAVACLALLCVQGYQLATYCKPTQRFTHLSLKKYLVASACPVAVVIGCLKLADWVGPHRVGDPLFVAGILEPENQEVFKQRVKEGKVNLMAYLLNGYDSRNPYAAQAQHLGVEFGRYGIFPKEQCAKTAVLMEVFTQLGWVQMESLTSEEQPQAVREAVQAAKKIWTISQ